MKTNFDKYLAEQQHDEAFVARYKRADTSWEVAVQVVALREKAGLTRKELAALARISQQQVNCLESPVRKDYTLGTLRNVANVLHARVRVVFEPEKKDVGTRVTEALTLYGKKPGRRKPVKIKGEPLSVTVLKNRR